MEIMDQFEKYVQVTYTNERGTKSRIRLIRYLADYLAENKYNRPELVQRLHDQIVAKYKKKHGNEGRTNLPIPKINLRITHAIWNMIPFDDDEDGAENCNKESSGLPV